MTIGEREDDWEERSEPHLTKRLFDNDGLPTTNREKAQCEQSPQR